MNGSKLKGRRGEMTCVFRTVSILIGSLVSGHIAKQEGSLAKGHMKGSQNQGYIQKQDGGITLNLLAWCLEISCFLCFLKDDL
jgi:hypothetical protein